MSDLSYDVECAIQLLEAHHHRVLRPFDGGHRAYGHTPSRDVRCGLMLDTETTGPDVLHDQIIQLAAVPFLFDGQTGRILEVKSACIMYEEPTVPVSPEAFAVHGITADRYQGQIFDADALTALVAAADVLCAHNAPFDRPLLDRRFPDLPAKPWACTYLDIPWRAAGYASSSLGLLLIEHTNHHFHGHDAAADCYAALHCLAYPIGGDAQGDPLYPMSHVLRKITEPSRRLFATNAAFDDSPKLKARGYKWNDPRKPGATFPKSPKAWWIECEAEALEAELAWLNAHVYHGSAHVLVNVEVVPVTQRFAR